jgi:four helix bundle protein
MGGQVPAQTIISYQDLKVWQEAMALAEAAYRLVAKLRRIGANGLADQMWRSAISVPANIAEGYGRGSARAYAQFLKIARGSLNELETEILLARRIYLLDVNQTEPLISSIERVSKMLNALIKSLRGRALPD